jgi:hypothetical protein
MADRGQKSTGVESHLYARAFVVSDVTRGACVGIVVADIWSGTRRVKEGVIRRLARLPCGSFLRGEHTAGGNAYAQRAGRILRESSLGLHRRWL